ncbi:MAG: LysM peptidoglycan-binding domain-containing protein [Oscillospiraceae bacterium]|nr:LysM peptidoglycan-binding domain-containing protein [Oscillospiraceae bacterium]
MELKGIDVSAFQGFVDWPRVAEEGIKFAMIRSSYGKSGVDSRFRENIINIQNTKIPAGAYHYCYAMNENEAVAEAKHFIDTVSGFELKYPLALDIEERSIANLGKDKITDIIVAFTNELKKSNYFPMVYLNSNWVENYVNISRIPDLDIWLAHWAQTPSYTKNVGIWQYSNSGDVNGIGNNIDLDISYKDYESEIKNLGMNKPIESQPSEPSTPSVPSPPTSDGQESLENLGPVLYTVRVGDTLWNLSQRFTGDGQNYKEIMTVNELPDETIHTGQTLLIPQNRNTNWALYSVARGDTLWSLARKYLGSWSRYNEIINLNNLSNDSIYAGQILKIPKNNSNQNNIYTVKSGDTLSEISLKLLGNAERYHEIMDANGLTSTVIKPGQKLKIPTR